MPVRSSNSSVLVWPDRERVDTAAREWARDVAANRADVRRIGYFGSYARGDYGVGSDLDLVAIVEDANEAFEQRSVAWPVERLPVPAELLVYTEDEWERVIAGGGRFGRMLAQEVVWIWPNLISR